jgi:Anti-sigma-K factor rskA, C-terminal
MSLPFGPDHDRWADASGSYVLGAMPDAEAVGFVAHLQLCAACRAEVAELEPAANVLPASVTPVAAPATIGDRVMADVRREAQLLAAAGEGADRAPDAPPARARRAWYRWPAPALVAAALLVGLVVGLGVSGVIGGSDTRTITATASGAAAGTQARLIMDDGRAILTVSHMPQPGAGKVYEVWLKPSGGEPQPTQSLFSPRANGNASVAVPAAASQMESVLVTVEPDGGSDQPTGPPVLSARVS